MADWTKKDDRFVERLDQLLSELPLSKKNFFGNVAWFSDKNSQMALLAWGSNIAARVGDEESTILISSGRAHPFDPSGHRPKREYVLVPEDQLGSDKVIVNWAILSLKYVETLPPKPARTK